MRLVPVKYFGLSVVFMFMSVYILLLFCGLGGELNGNYIHLKGIYFDYHDFVCMLGVLFVANLEGVFCQFLSGTSGVKWNLYNDRKKRKKIKGILIDVKNIFLICLTLIWVFISYQTLHHQCGDTTSNNQPPELQAKNYIVYARDNQPCFLSSYIFLYACTELPVKSMHRKKITLYGNDFTFKWGH